MILLSGATGKSGRGDIPDFWTTKDIRYRVIVRNADNFRTGSISKNVEVIVGEIGRSRRLRPPRCRASPKRYCLSAIVKSRGEIEKKLRPFPRPQPGVEQSRQDILDGSGGRCPIPCFPNIIIIPSSIFGRWILFLDLFCGQIFYMQNLLLNAHEIRNQATISLPLSDAKIATDRHCRSRRSGR